MPTRQILLSTRPEYRVPKMRWTAEEARKSIDDYKPETIEALQKWLQENPHYPPTSEESLILFAHSCYYDVEKTKACIDSCYNLKSATPEFFQKRDVDKYAEVRHILGVTDNAVFPTMTPSGYQIIFHRLSQYEPSKYVFADGVKVLNMTMESARCLTGPAKGYFILFDMTGVKLGHLTRLNLGLLKKFFMFIQEANPVRLKGIHVINTMPIVDKIMFLIKPFMKKELHSILHFYSSSEMEKLYEVIPKECLPSDFGGSLGKTVAELHARNTEVLKDLKDIWNDDETLVIDESKRPSKKGKKAREDAMPDIRKLDLD
ncbi:alpha-tocopherol transfer protein-like isoform X1 [Frankliniella occidentalis]|uniref:Alpha-tocopherol transfer protein-like isoform X1 n=2 Tax=Frankliniella occidentalis TaxID=133901 RepID=A0A9C6X5Q8_FRAOC|nr:alpha-tocopherol transfer protein-like isoform X1 [Frankliniella occidentalis]